MNPLTTDIEETLETEPKRIGETMKINLGPSHPAMHGTLRLMLELDGEIIKRCKIELGYLHRCFEKMSETHTWQQVIPFTDRLNYCSSFMNNVGYCLAVEKMLGIEAPPRAQAIRVILSELSRIMDHLVCVGTNLVDIGALTNFWYFFRGREDIYSLLEACCGARLTVSYCRIGGLVQDVPPDFKDRVKHLIKTLPGYFRDVDTLVARNKIFMDRTLGVGPVTKEQAQHFGYTGPCLRACGVEYDVRKAAPYQGYDQYDFEIPTADNGDTYSRYLVRSQELWQSLRIVEQALDKLPDGDFLIKDPRIALPPKEDVYSNIEALMNHFKLIMHGVEVPPGEVYSYTEGANGELGFFLVSDGSKSPHRVRVRPPCFAIYQSVEEILIGQMVADAIAIVGSLNIIAGELDR